MTRTMTRYLCTLCGCLALSAATGHAQWLNAAPGDSFAWSYPNLQFHEIVRFELRFDGALLVLADVDPVPGVPNTYSSPVPSQLDTSQHTLEVRACSSVCGPWSPPFFFHFDAMPTPIAGSPFF